MLFFRLLKASCGVGFNLHISNVYSVEGRFEKTRILATGAKMVITVTAWVYLLIQIPFELFCHVFLLLIVKGD